MVIIPIIAITIVAFAILTRNDYGMIDWTAVVLFSPFILMLSGFLFYFAIVIASGIAETEYKTTVEHNIAPIQDNEYFQHIPEKNVVVYAKCYGTEKKIKSAQSQDIIIRQGSPRIHVEQPVWVSDFAKTLFWFKPVYYDKITIYHPN